MNVFVDYHHGDLFFSLHLLFEERLGWKLYRPIGNDWFTEGYWKIAEPYGNAPDTIEQYLGITNDGYVPYKHLNGDHLRMDDGTYRVLDPTHHWIQKAISLDVFKSMPFDLIISSLPCHDGPFLDLRNKYQPKAKVISQMGNWKQTTELRHVLYSMPYIPRPGQHALYYHQEIDRNLFKPTPLPRYGKPKIISMVNLLPYPEIYQAFKSSMPDLEFRAYGAGCPDGAMNGAAEIAPTVAEATFGWHIKPFDGFSHTAMAWMASGRAVITRMDEVHEYGWDAPRLFMPGDTCLALGPHFAENVQMIRLALPAAEALGRAAAKRFDEVCNYEEEFLKIKSFLEAVL